jgi:hypothetical protein
MNVVIYFGNEIETVTNSRITITALYALAQKSVSQAARDAALKLMKQGNALINTTLAESIIDGTPDGKWTPPPNKNKQGPAHKNLIDRAIDRCSGDLAKFTLLVNRVIGECASDDKKWALLVKEYEQARELRERAPQ